MGVTLPGLICASFLVFVSGCNPDLSTFGFNLTAVSGDHQSTAIGSTFPLPLKVQVTDSAGNPQAGVVVNFVEITDTQSDVVNGSVETDANGDAETTVIATQSLNATIKIEAQLENTNAQGPIFQLTTGTASTGEQYQVVTTHSDVEVAGTPFGLTVTLLDSSGEVLKTANDSIDLSFTFQTANSWTGTAPTFPQTLSCQFSQGVCTTPSLFTLTNATAVSKITVADTSSNSLPSPLTPITVTKGTAAGLAIATAAGGPAANAVALGSTTTMLATDAARTYYAAVTDSAGNYLQDDVTGQAIANLPNGAVGVGAPAWDTSDANILSAIGNSAPVTNASVGFNPGASATVGTGTLKLGDGTLNNTFIDKTFEIDVGLPSQLIVHTQHTDNETAGIRFNLVATAADAKGNTVTNINGAYSTSYVLNLASSVAFQLSGGCDRFYDYFATAPLNEVWQTFGNCGLGNISAATVMEDFVNGVMNSLVQVFTSYDGNALPKITATATISQTLSLSGSRTLSTVSSGQPDHVNIFNQFIPQPHYLCNQAMISNSSLACPLASPGNPSVSGNAGGITLYAVVEDGGGNILPAGNTGTTATWIGSGAWAPVAGVSQFVNSVDGSGNPDVIFTPVTQGAGSVEIIVTGGGCQGNATDCRTVYYGKTVP